MLGDVKSLNKTVEDNVDSKLKNFMKDLEKRIRTQEKLLESRMNEVEKKIDSVSGKTIKTKKESVMCTSTGCAIAGVIFGWLVAGFFLNWRVR